MATTKAYPYLVQILEKHLPQLDHDINNASTLYTLQAAVKQLHQYVTYAIHHIVEDGYNNLRAAGLPPLAAAPVQAPVPVPRPIMTAIPRPAGAIEGLRLPTLGNPSAPGFPEGTPAVGQAKVMEVSITPSGTSVALPGGPTIQLPPGSPVEFASEPILTGPNDVVLAPGGGIGPEAQAALAAAGGARNITQDPAP